MWSLVAFWHRLQNTKCIWKQYKIHQTSEPLATQKLKISDPFLVRQPVDIGSKSKIPPHCLDTGQLWETWVPTLCLPPPPGTSCLISLDSVFPRAEVLSYPSQPSLQNCADCSFLVLLIENKSEKTGLEGTLRGHQVHLPVPAESDTDLICVLDFCHLLLWQLDESYTIFFNKLLHGCTVIFTMRKLSLVSKQDFCIDNFSPFHFALFSKDIESMPFS